jgi:hypothetical protein
VALPGIDSAIFSPLLGGSDRTRRRPIFSMCKLSQRTFRTGHSIGSLPLISSSSSLRKTMERNTYMWTSPSLEKGNRPRRRRQGAPRCLLPVRGTATTALIAAAEPACRCLLVPQHSTRTTATVPRGENACASNGFESCWRHGHRSIISSSILSIVQ